MGEIIYRDVQVSQLARRLGLSKVCISNILDSYIGYLKDRISCGETVKFLNVCYLKVEGKDIENKETLAYISHEIADELRLGQSVVYRVLTSFEEYMISDLQKFYSYSIRGLVRIRLKKNYNGEFKVRVKKSTVYNGCDVYVSTLNSFKRRVEIL